MVGPLILVKWLHCKRMNSGNQTIKRDSVTEGTSQEEILKKIIKKENCDENICRVCLKEGTIPIYGNDSINDISEGLNTFGGIDARSDDPYPKYLCDMCNTLLQGAILFRKTAQQSDELLKRTPEELPQDVDNGIEYLEDDNDFSEYKERKIKKRKQHNCKKCKVSFDSVNEYNEHKLSEEHENMRIECPVCQKSYTELYFKKHILLHNKEVPYVCDICGKKMIFQGQFTRHRLTHFYDLPYKCSLCPYKGRFSESLKMHMRSHTGEKPYQCTQCLKRFINKSNLNKHMWTHKGEHAFKCDVCGRGFYTKRELEMHIKVNHTGIKDHVCNICGKPFGYRKQMMKHQLKVHKRAKLRSGRMPLYLKVESMKEQEQKKES